MGLLDTARYSLWVLWQHRALCMPAAALRAARECRLRGLLRHAAARSPFYRDKFAGLDPERCRLADLPVTTKSEMMADFDRVSTDPRVSRAGVEAHIDGPGDPGRLYLGRYPVCHTSGSQGQPLLVVQSPLVLDLLFAFQMSRGNATFGLAEPLRRLAWPARLAVLSSTRGAFASAMAWRHAPAAFHRFVRLLAVPPGDPDLVEKLNDFAPTALTAYPSVLGQLALKADRLTFLPGLRQVTAHSEELTATARSRLRAAFGAPVLNNYAMAECLFLSNGCPAGPGAHVNADWAILEVVDGANRPVAPGAVGDKVLITNLANTVQPVIRYEVGDRAEIGAGPCGCGSRLPWVRRVEGRAADVFWARAGAGRRPLTFAPFHAAFLPLRDVREWQAVEESEGRIVVRLEPLPGATPDVDRARRLLAEQLDAAGLAGLFHLSFELVPRLGPDPVTGKFKRFLRRDALPAGPPPRVAGR